MKKTLSLKILSPSRVFFTGDVYSLSVPGALGMMEIYPQHTNLVSTLVPGYIKLTMTDNSIETYFTNGGYIEISNDVNLIVDDIIQESDINQSYLNDKLVVLKEKLNSPSVGKLSDYEYETLTQHVALYQQFTTYL